MPRKPNPPPKNLPPRNLAPAAPIASGPVNPCVRWHLLHDCGHTSIEWHNCREHAQTGHYIRCENAPITKQMPTLKKCPNPLCYFRQIPKGGYWDCCRCGAKGNNDQYVTCKAQVRRIENDISGQYGLRCCEHLLCEFSCVLYDPKGKVITLGGKGGKRKDDSKDVSNKRQRGLPGSGGAGGRSGAIASGNNPASGGGRVDASGLTGTGEDYLSFNNPSTSAGPSAGSGNVAGSGGTYYPSTPASVSTGGNNQSMASTSGSTGYGNAAISGGVYPSPYGSVGTYQPPYTSGGPYQPAYTSGGPYPSTTAVTSTGSSGNVGGSGAPASQQPYSDYDYGYGDDGGYRGYPQ